MPRWIPFEPYFWSLVDKSGDCWIWTGNIDARGYGRVHKDNRRQRAHRVAYELSIGEIPEGLLACHSCDNKRCVNPSHIFIGTQKDNMQDWTKKGLNKAVVNGIFSKKGDDHWKRTERGIKYTEEWAKKLSHEFSIGKRKVIRGEKGRVIGTQVL